MKSFNDIYTEVYKKSAQPLEDLRKKAIYEYIFVFIILFIIGIIISIIINSTSFMFLIFFIQALYFIFSNKITKYKAYFKENVIKEFVKAYSTSLDFYPHSGISTQTYIDGEFEGFDRFHSEDLITGTLPNGFKISMSEVHTEYKSQDNKGNTYYHTLFHGLYANIVFDKILDTNLEIRRNNLFGAKKKFDKSTIARRNIPLVVKEKIDLDSSEFEKLYDVYSSNKIIAMQILTSDIMQILIDFKEKNKLIPELTLKKDKLYIRFSTGDQFEGSIFRKTMDFKILKKYYDIINLTLGVSEMFLKNISETEF